MAGTALQPVVCGALVLWLVACGSPGNQGPHASAGPSTITADTTPTETSTYGDRQQTRLNADDVDGMTAAAGSLWVKTDSGHVLRIDPTTNDITADMNVDKRAGQSFYCQGIGAVSGSVWACATRTAGVGVAEIDPGAARITRVVPVGKVFDQLSLPSTARGVWVLTSDGTAVSVVDPASGRVASYPLGARCQQLAAAGNRVVATSLVENIVVVLHAGSGRVFERLNVGAPRMAALVGDDVWVDSVDGLTRFSHDLAVRTIYPGMSAGQGGDLFASGGSVWLRGSDGTISRIDAGTGKVLERIVPRAPISAGSLVVAYGSIWTTANNEGWVFRLREEQ